MKDLILKIIIGVLIVVLIGVIFNLDKIAYSKINTNGASISECEKFVTNYPSSQYVHDAIDRIYMITRDANEMAGYEDFIQKYPNSTYVDDAHDRIYGIVTTSKFVSDYESFITKYPNSKYVDDAHLELWKIIKSKRVLFEMHQYANTYPFIKYSKEARKIVDKMCAELYQKAIYSNTINAWNHYKSSVPSRYHKDADVRIKTIENEPWSTDYKAWNQARKENTITSFYKYLKLYPNGNYKTSADKKIIDLEVADVFSKDHGVLPSMTKSNYGNKGFSSVNIYNNTSYTLTIRYSGSSSKKVDISPRKRKTVTLNNGNYKIAASANLSNIRNFAGTEYLSGGDYEVEYYITTQRY